MLSLSFKRRKQKSPFLCSINPLYPNLLKCTQSAMRGNALPKGVPHNNLRRNTIAILMRINLWIPGTCNTRNTLIRPMVLVNPRQTNNNTDWILSNPLYFRLNRPQNQEYVQEGRAPSSNRPQIDYATQHIESKEQ